MPRALDVGMIEEIVAAYGLAAGRLAEAGLDGIEVPASHGLLPAQFLNPRVNVRTDQYGGDLDNRLRFIREILSSVRERIGQSLVLGIRVSVDELEYNGLVPEESQEICQHLAALPELDYLNVIAGSMAGLSGSVHVVPPMTIDHGYTAPLADMIKTVTDKPVFVAGRINQPQIAEQILASGQADMCGMTRALIADPEMPNKTASGDIDNIRACIGCNQACIGHYHLGTSISCIQFPATGRERLFGRINRAENLKSVVVIGAGPAGLKAAATAAERGHRVTLCEASESVGGQVNLAHRLPGRTEFAGLTTNLLREAENAGVAIKLNTRVDIDWLKNIGADTVVLSTGATPYRPELPGIENANVIDPWQVLSGEADVGQRVVVADWRGDWVGIGIAELLVRNGCHVRLAVNGSGAGQAIQSYMRYQWLGTIHKLGVEVTPYVRLFGVDEDSAYFQHTLNNEPVQFEAVDTLIISLGHTANTVLEDSIRQSGISFRMVGDCLSPRTAEEAVYEGMLAGLEC
jgi:thioredoxin reductase